MCCFFASLVLIGPRFGILVWWLFEPDRWQQAFDNFIWAFLGFLFAPWTTMMYVAVAPNGLTGFDWIQENGADVVEVAELVYGKVGRKPLRWVLAVPEGSPISSPADLAGARIATEAVGMTERYLAKAVNRITLPGAVFIAIIAILPYLLLLVAGVNSFGFAGTSVLISVGVALELMRQIDSQLTLRNYEGFLK